MKSIILVFSLISLFSYSQNKESYFASRISDGLYEYLDSVGVKKLESYDSCDCSMFLEAKIKMYAIKEDAYDSLLLNDFADEDLIESLIYSLKNEFRKSNFDKNPPVKEIYFEVNVKQLSNRFSIIKWKRKVKYKLIVDLNYKPNKENETKKD